jgi:hypothetical protein
MPRAQLYTGQVRRRLHLEGFVLKRVLDLGRKLGVRGRHDHRGWHAAGEFAGDGWAAHDRDPPVPGQLLVQHLAHPLVGVLFQTLAHVEHRLVVTEVRGGVSGQRAHYPGRNAEQCQPGLGERLLERPAGRHALVESDAREIPCIEAVDADVL